MKKFIFGVIVGLAIPKIKDEYDFRAFSKEHPEDPDVVKALEAKEEFRASIRKLRDEIKKAWEQAKVDADTKVEFEAIIRDIDK